MKKTTNILIVLIFAFLFPPNLATAEPELQWEKTYGGTNSDEGYCVQQTFDGGYIIVGNTYSSDSQSYDILLIKTDTNGICQWEKTFNAYFDEFARSVQQTSDGGYIIAGCTETFGFDNDADVYIIKTDSSGNLQWEKTFGGSDWEYGESVQQTSDDGYIIAGCTYSYGPNDKGDVYLIKTDGNGNSQWEQNFGGRDFDSGRSVQQTSDGGYIITGYTRSYGSEEIDVFLIKTDSAGISQWYKTFGGNDWDEGQSVRQTSDGGFIITGYTYSYGAGLGDVYLIKTDDSGEPQWERTLGANHTDKGLSVEQTSDGGYIITGNTQSYGYGGTDVYLVKTCSNGYLEWEKTFGGNNWDYGKSIEVTSDGGYIIAGYTYSFGAGKSDIYLIKLSDDYLTGQTIYVDDDGPADFNNIQAAIDDANGGDTVLVAPGIYTINQRIIVMKSITIKSEQGPATCIVDCQGLNIGGFGFYENNMNATIEGFTITKGCGGISIGLNSIVSIKNCIIVGNNRAAPESIIGSGLDISGSAKANISNCLITGNMYSGHHGVSSYQESYGGGVFCSSTSASVFRNCTISGNKADIGGGIACTSFVTMRFENCIISDNISNLDDGSIGIKTITIPAGGAPPIGNVIFDYCLIDDEPNALSTPDEIFYLEECIVGNPEFTNPGYWDPNGSPDDANDDYWIKGDYHLKSQAGRWDPNSESWVQDDVNSPCIDTGDPNDPVGGEPRPNGGRINMGAYGGTSEASMSLMPPQSNDDLKAFEPYPYDTAVGVEINPTLSWSSGATAVAHDVYFNTNYNNVNNATISNPRDILVSQEQTSNSYSPGTLSYNRTYYWRVDEVDEQGNRTKGDIWLFITRDGGTKGRACFLPNTPIWIDDGFVPILTVTTGQVAGAFNTAIVENLQEHVGMYECRDIILENGNCISVVESHYFLLESGIWISSQNLKSGMKLKTMNGSITIENVERREMPYVGKVYNVKVSGTHRYMVGEDAVIVRDY